MARVGDKCVCRGLWLENVKEVDSLKNLGWMGRQYYSGSLSRIEESGGGIHLVGDKKGSCERVNEPLVSAKCGEFLN